MQMKVAYLLGSLNRGGMETLLLDLFRSRKKTSFDILGIHRKEGSLKDDFVSSQVPLYLLKPKFPFDPYYLFRLRKLLLAKSVTIVHAQQCLDALYAKIALFGTNVKVVQTFHGYDFGYTRMQRWFVKWSLQWCDINIFVSKTQQSYFQNKYGFQSSQKNRVVYNGIDFAKMNLETPNGELSKNSQCLQLGMVGNFVRGRNPFFICKALSVLKEQGVEFDFYFVGRRDKKEPWRFDECVKYCKEYGLSSNVHFLGARDDVSDLLKKWDIFVYATDHDTFGIAVLEAIASGCPVLVNDWDVMREVTCEGMYATLYKTRDEKDLVAKIEECRDNMEQKRLAAKEHAKHVRELYSMERYIPTLKDVYDSICR